MTLKPGRVRWYHTTKPPYVPYHATITTSRLPRCCFGRTKANAPAGACNSVPSSSGESALMSTTWQITQQMAFLALQYGMIAFWLSRRSQPAYHTTLHNSMVAIVLASLLWRCTGAELLGILRVAPFATFSFTVKRPI